MNRRTTSGRLAKTNSAVQRGIKRNRPRIGFESLETRAMLSAVTWTIDQAQSSVSITIPDQPYEIDDGMGTTFSGELQIRNQSGGNSGPWNVGNTAQVAGTIDTLYADGSAIQFLSGQTNITGVNSGSYRPDPAAWNGIDFGGSTATGPGVFGGRLFPTIDQVFGLALTVGYFNFTDVFYDVDSGALPITAGSFPANTTDIGISSAVANVQGVSIIVVGQILPDAQEAVADLLDTNQAPTGTITSPDPIGQPDLRELTFPILQNFSLEISPGAPPFTGTISGQIVATGTVPPPTSVVGRHLFYNDSKYDNNTPGIDPADASAIATDKSAYLPGGGLITSASMSAYDKGINGIMVDLSGAHGPLTLADFEFAMSEQGGLVNNTPSTWVAAPAPSGFTVLADTPAVGTDRVEFIWPTGTIVNRYLEVTVKGNDAAGGFNLNTGLPATDFFYYGNRSGDDFLATPPVTFNTTAGDEIDARNNPGFLQPLTNIYDYNKDSLVSAADQIAARNNAGFQFKINITGPPPPAPTGDDDGGSSAVASALAIRRDDTAAASTVPNSLIRESDAEGDDPAAASTDSSATMIAEPAGASDEAESSAIDLALDDELLDSLLGDL